MSTRATYQIDNMFFYCHYDGYPEGATQRFLNMVQALTRPDPEASHCVEDRRGGLAFAFIRGNLDAEPTKSHEHHGDTEYRWTLTRETDGTITVTGHHKQRHINLDHYQWTGAYLADLADFINQHANPQQPERIIRASVGNPAPQIYYATVANAEDIANHLLYQSTRFELNNPNRKSHRDRAHQWMSALEPRSEDDKQ